jgi:DNA repair ATPase RecN
VDQELSERINRVESAESILQVTLAEYREFHTNTDKTLENMRNDLAKLRDQQVTRGEHQQKWDADTAAFSRVQNEIDEIKRDFGSAYSLNDKIKELQTELNDIRHAPTPTR